MALSMSIRRLSQRLLATLLALSPTLGYAQAAIPDATPDASVEHQRQRERAEALRRELEKGTAVRRPAGPAPDASRLPEGETPCFRIERVTLGGPDAAQVPWLSTALAGPTGEDPPQGRCLGAEGIQLVLRRAQNELLARGYLTSRVVVPNQDLQDGDLEIAVHAGRLARARFREDSTGRNSLATAIPVRAGEILNLRDIEQALENLKRVPGADADIEIQPSETPGASDLVAIYRAGPPWHLSAAADDGGLEATGKYQGSLTAAYDNPLGLNDLAYLALNHDLMADGARRGSWGVLAHYSVPFGYWSGALTASRNRDHQTVAGATTHYIYGGFNTFAELTLSRTLHRDGVGKTTLTGGLWRRTSRNFIDDTEVEVQRRQTAGWQLGLDHRRYLGTATLDTSLDYRQGTGALGAIPAPEQIFGEGTARFRKSVAELRLEWPFATGARRLAYVGVLRGQFSHSERLNPQEMFVIGGRYTVRGFDGENVLAAERGWLLRNELILPLQGIESAAYLGLDAGGVDGPTAGVLAGRRLAGAVLGLRGNLHGLSFDLFAGAPLHKPDRFDAPARTAGFRIAYAL